MMTEKIIALILILMFCQAEKGKTQDHGLGLNISSGVLLKTYAYPLATIGLGYKYKFLEARLSYTKSFLTHGRRKVIWNSFALNEEIIPKYKRYEYKEVNILELVLLTNIKIGDYVGYAGGGVHWQNKPYSLRRNHIGGVAFMGYKLNQFDFSLTIYSTPFRNKIRPLLKVGYNIPLIKQANKNSELEFWELQKEKKEVRFSFVVSGRYQIPLDKEYPATASTSSVALNYYLKEKYRFHLTADVASSAYGADSDSFSVSIINTYKRTISQYTRIASYGRIALGCSRILKIKQNIDFDYGGGISLNCRTGCNIFNRNSPYISRSSLGLFAQSQLRIGPFSNGIELNVPLWKLPPTISFFWAVGINFRKKGKKLTAYDHVPQY